MPSKEVVEQQRKLEERRQADEQIMRKRRREERRQKRRKLTARRWDELIARIPSDEPSVGVEVGVYRGATALQVLQKRPYVTHIMVDPWNAATFGSRYDRAPGQMQHGSQEHFDQVYEELMRKLQTYKGRAQVMRMRSVEAATQVEPHSLDYVFIDGEHSYEAVREDIVAWFPKIKHGGWIGGHDYNSEGYEGLKKAVEEAFPDGVEEGVDHTWWRKVE